MDPITNFIVNHCVSGMAKIVMPVMLGAFGPRNKRRADRHLGLCAGRRHRRELVGEGEDGGGGGEGEGGDVEYVPEQVRGLGSGRGAGVGAVIVRVDGGGTGGIVRRDEPSERGSGGDDDEEADEQGRGDEGPV